MQHKLYMQRIHSIDMQTNQTQMGNGLTVDSIMWNSGSIQQRITYAKNVLSQSEFPVIFSGSAVKGWKQLPLKIRRRIQGSPIGVN